ncbi:MAG: fibronectin type III domain-containing protein [Clostridia bacterium]|nr:fibronectin type III domain-containing protein [Clostridia bacterium]
MNEFNSIEKYLEDNLNHINGGQGGGTDGDTEGENPPPEIITGVIEFGGLSWTSGKANVTITKTTSDDYKIEYKITNSSGEVTTNYTEIANGGTVANLNLGDIVTARLTDGVNKGNSASITVADKNPPTAEITVGTVTRDSITVTATGTDAESGVKNYTFEYKLSTSNSYTGTTKKTTTSHTFEGLTAGQTYNIKVTVTDNAGNTKEATVAGSTLAPTPTPTPGKDDLWDPDLGSTPTPTPGKDDLWDPDLGSTPTPTPGKDDLWDPDLGSTPTPTPGKDDLWDPDLGSTPSPTPGKDDLWGAD